MEFIGQGRPLTRKGLAEVLDRLGLGPSGGAYIWTVVEVETAGVTQGFGFRQDRRPQILFERHTFRNQTQGRFNDEAPEVSGPPGGYGPLSAQYDRLGAALALCRREGLGVEPALKSASWGMGQVMGFNHQAAGFPTAEAMVAAMLTGEDAQLSAMAGFLLANGLADFLQRQDWAGFARRYNGPTYWKNQYDVKLAEQFQRFSGGSGPDLELRTAQAALLYLGYSPGKIDGVMGPRTRATLQAFRVASGLPPGEGLDGVVYQGLCQGAGFQA